MLLLAYLVAISASISLRRLGVLFLAALFVTNIAAHGSQSPERTNWAVEGAMAITAIIWATPLAAFVVGLLRRNPRAACALDDVSGSVLWSYGFAIALFGWLFVARGLSYGVDTSLGTLAYVMGWCAVLAFGFPMMWRRVRERVPLAQCRDGS